MSKTSDPMSKCSDGSPPSGAHGGGWAGLGEDGGEPGLKQIIPSSLVVMETEMRELFRSQLGKTR